MIYHDWDNGLLIATMEYIPVRCPQCGGRLSEMRTNGPFPVVHCFSCNFDFAVDKNGFTEREVEEDGDR